MERVREYLNSIGDLFMINATNNPTVRIIYNLEEALSTIKTIVNKVYIFNPNKKLIGIIEYKVDNGKNEDDLFSSDNAEFLIRRLWNNGEIKANKKLIPKAKVINIKKRREVTKIGDLYRILLEVKAVETKSANSGYYSLVDMETAISLYWKWRLM